MWLHERFLKTYRWDLAKVMSDYRYPLPDGLHDLREPGSLRAFEPVALDHPAFARRRSPNNPSLRELRRRSDRCLMGGIDESGFPDMSLGMLARQVDDAVEQAGREGFILAPGCALPSFSPRRTLEFLREYSRAEGAFRP